MKTIGSTFVRKYDDVFLFLKTVGIATFLSPPLSSLYPLYSTLNKNQLSHIIQLALIEKSNLKSVFKKKRKNKYNIYKYAVY